MNGLQILRTGMTTCFILDYEVTDKTLYNAAIFNGRGLCFADSAGSTLPKGTHPLSLVVDRSVQKMGEGPHYITNRQLPADVEAVTLCYEGMIVHTFPLQ